MILTRSETPALNTPEPKTSETKAPELLRLQDVVVHHRHQAKATLKTISLGIHSGDIACLLGPSGCGKTTLLRAIAGFLPIQAGSITLAGEVVSHAKRIVNPEHRGIGMVFQDYALFPHLNVQENVSFGLQHLPLAQRQDRQDEIIALVGLEPFLDRYPHQLSGGQQQRVALARALAPRPALLLMDEPFSNLDVELREKLSHEVRDILKRSQITALMVTHDQTEAFTLADRIGVLHNGVLLQWDSPYRVYHEPVNRTVADFVGRGVFLPAQVKAGQVVMSLGTLGAVPPPAADGWQAQDGETVDVFLRPDDILHDDASPLRAKVMRKAFRGADFLYTLELPDGAELLALVPSHHDHAIGEAIGIRLEIDHLILFPHQFVAHQSASAVSETSS